MKKLKKNQINSRMYYVFWGIVTISVVAGQVYVGNGYRMMTDRIISILEYIEYR